MRINRKKYLTYLETITPKISNATKELRNKTKALDLKTVLKEARKFQSKS